MIYMILAIPLLIATGIVLANYELRKTRRERRELLRQRGRRGVRLDR